MYFYLYIEVLIIRLLSEFFLLYSCLYLCMYMMTPPCMCTHTCPVKVSNKLSCYLFLFSTKLRSAFKYTFIMMQCAYNTVSCNTHLTLV